MHFLKRGNRDNDDYFEKHLKSLIKKGAPAAIAIPGTKQEMNGIIPEQLTVGLAIFRVLRFFALSRMLRLHKSDNVHPFFLTTGNQNRIITIKVILRNKQHNYMGIYNWSLRVIGLTILFREEPLI